MKGTHIETCYKQRQHDKTSMNYDACMLAVLINKGCDACLLLFYVLAKSKVIEAVNRKALKLTYRYTMSI